MTFEREEDARAKLAALFPVLVQMEKYAGGKRTRVVRILARRGRLADPAAFEVTRVSGPPATRLLPLLPSTRPR